MDLLSAALEREPGSAYLLSLDLRLLYVNEGWQRFARENGAPQLATNFRALGSLSHLPSEPLGAFYRSAFSRVLTRAEPWRHTYDCSSAELHRNFSMQVDLTPARDAFVVVNSNVIESPWPSTPQEGIQSHVSGRAIIVQCANCRRLRGKGEIQTWNWVPQLVNINPVDLSHGLCPMCDLLHYCGLDSAHK